jgi:hypothetical protein
MLPTNIWFWVFVVVIIAAIAVYAIWSRKVQVRLGLKGLEFTPADSNANADQKVTVAQNAEIAGRAERIVGRKVTDADAARGTTDVAGGARISGTVGEIVGLDQSKPQR